jgi:hypothetical protein
MANHAIKGFWIILALVILCVGKRKRVETTESPTSPYLLKTKN